jgi:plastocyanin
MGRKLLIIIVLILIVGGIAAAVTHKSSNNTNNSSQTSSTPTNTNQNKTNNTSTQAKAATTINIANMQFTPSQVSIKKGGTVTWTNNDSTTHTVVDDLSNVGGPNSGNIDPGKTYSFTFNNTGSFQYHCSIHPSMRGTIVVQ